ncbi:hypothetical protein Poli38472_003883 [Pythium oligandrum]|uniref:Transmembrane protein n=1 Tax=Pythium oligandrum TaxID=41045 RepID=A0A8K1FPZ9_PYTOL|nr:hypothetical protein Poli38472_003883 [Pythium oligandrum]|eukprot:TMW66118.1 hypothetical protein Poli38472_003883 [Pythium oligandrum]
MTRPAIKRGNSDKGSFKSAQGSTTSTSSTREDTTGFTIRIAKSKGTGPRGSPSRFQILHLMHRLFVVLTATSYTFAAIEGVVMSIEALEGNANPTLQFATYETLLMRQMVGVTTIKESPLMKILNNDVTPRADTLYIDGVDGDYVSFTSCASRIALEAIYANAFQRSIYAALVQQTAYNLTFLDPSESELIAPVVDCTSSAIVLEDASAGRFFYLVRNKKRSLDADDVVYLLALSLSNQGYVVPSRGEKGSAGVVTVAAFHDLRSQDVEHHFVVSLGFPFEQLRYQVYEYVTLTEDSYWVLRNVPRDKLQEVPRILFTASRTGFYRRSEIHQSNVKNQYWELHKDPLDVVGYYQWTGVPVLIDNWAWVHLVHIYFAVDVLVQLVILLFVVYRNWQQGKLWIGDAFVRISHTLVIRGFAVLITWYINNFWALLEYCYAIGNIVSDVEQVYIHPDVVRADLMAIFLMLSDLIGKATRERLDPVLCFVLFLLGFELSPKILRWFPAFVAVLEDRTLSDYQLGVIETVEDISIVSPMRLWDIHPMTNTDPTFIFVALAPILLMFVPIFVYIILRKLWMLHKATRAVVVNEVRPFDAKRVRRPTNVSGTTVITKQLRESRYTQFEIATGGELKEYYGLITDFESNRVIKGLTFASADGIYSNGFVIVDRQFLVATSDILAILAIKITRIRYRNVYVYDVDGNNVQKMARLVYPQTLSFRQLRHLNISVLS